MSASFQSLDTLFRNLLMENRTPAKTLPTGIGSLDRLMRGESGIPMRRLVIISGAPGAGKTAFALFLAHRAAKAGHPCAWFAADEEPQTLIDRIAQMEGAAQPTIDAGDAAALAGVEDRLRAMAAHLRFYDQDDGVTLDEVESWLQSESKAAKKPGVLVVDSLQTIGADTADGSAKSRVEAVVAAVKEFSRRGHLVLATCEVARESYRSAKASYQTNPMAAGKETGAIEYAGKTLIHLREVKDGPAISVTVSKNRSGRKGSFQMELRGVSFHEPTITVAAHQGEGVRERIIAEAARGPKKKTALALAVGGNKQTALGVIQDLTSEGVLASDANGNLSVAS